MKINLPMVIGISTALSPFGASLNDAWQSLTVYLSIRFICTLKRLNIDLIIDVITFTLRYLNFYEINRFSFLKPLIKCTLQDSRCNGLFNDIL